MSLSNSNNKKKQHCKLLATHQMTHTAVVRRVSRSETQISSLFSCVSCSLHQVKLVIGLFSTVLFLAAVSSLRVVCCWEYITGNFPDLLLPPLFKMSSSVHKFERELCQPLYHLHVTLCHARDGHTQTLSLNTFFFVPSKADNCNSISSGMVPHRVKSPNMYHTQETGRLIC